MAQLNDDARRDGRLLVATLFSSLGLLALRLSVARGTGFGDSEALYASYALHPQPAYLDHPGLIGSIARLIGGGGAPRPELAHLVTSVAATLLPWVGALAALAAGAKLRGALAAALALMLVPELCIGLFGLSPDLPLAFFWLAALGAAAFALRQDAKSFVALGATLAVGALVGFAALSKVSGALLGLAFCAAWLSKDLRRRFATLAPWGALAVFAVLIAPVVRWEVREGYPMLHHRLLWTQVGAGVSLRNTGALIGGQLAYVTPPFLLAAGYVAIDLYKERAGDAVSRLLWLSFVVPAVPLVLLSIWSRVAEPHWVAPAYLPLALHFARSPRIGRRLSAACVATGIAVAALAWVWVKTPLPMKVLGAAYQPRYDLANDLYAWAPGGRMMEHTVARATIESRRMPVVIGPHWIVCAQLEALFGGRVPVGCNEPRPDDFDRWLPRPTWLGAKSVLYVSDSRFDRDPEKELPDHAVRSVSKVDVRRGGIVVRTIWVTHLERIEEVGLTRRPPTPPRR
jgi:Dolichyl-phosphate-mannose-protein mannosyltransferase